MNENKDELNKKEEGLENAELLAETFPSNSKTQKQKVERVASSEERVKKVEKVIVGEAKKQKRTFGKKMAEIFLEDDTKSVGSYLIHDVLIPAGKSLICDIVGWGGFAEMMLFGDQRGGRARGSSSIRRDGGRTVVNYGAYSSQSPSRVPIRGDVRDPRDRPRDISRIGRARHDFDEIVLETRGEAEDVLAILVDLTVDYGMASVADLYDAVGITSNFTDEKYGWTELRNATVSRVRGGYLLNLPRPQPLE